jgi:hypothetical protein
MNGTFHPYFEKGTYPRRVPGDHLGVSRQAHLREMSPAAAARLQEHQAAALQRITSEDVGGIGRLADG